jgi:hypothetical protein
MGAFTSEKGRKNMSKLPVTRESIQNMVDAYLAKGEQIKKEEPVSTVAQVKARHPGIKERILNGEFGDRHHGRGYVPDYDGESDEEVQS